MNGGEEVLCLVVLSPGRNAILQEDNEEVLRGVDPEPRTGVVRFAEASRREIVTARRILPRGGPAKRSRVCQERLRAGELHDRAAAQKPMVRINAAGQQHPREGGELARRGEQTRVACDAADRECPFSVAAPLLMGFRGPDLREWALARAVR